MRKNWLIKLKQFIDKKITKNEFNAYLKNNFGIPIRSFAKEEASLLPNIMIWNSNCKMKNPSKLFLAESFKINLSSDVIENFSQLSFRKVFFVDEKSRPQMFYTALDDLPIFIQNNSLFYLQQEEGLFYTLSVNFNGTLTIEDPIKMETLSFKNHSTKCPIELELRYKEKVKNNTDFQCENIWDRNKNSFRTFLFERNCL